MNQISFVTFVCVEVYVFGYSKKEIKTTKM